MAEHPNWLEMPDELMTNILQRLRTIEILNSAQKVCSTWRKVCKDPVMWKVIDMQNWFDDWEGNCDLQTLTKQAVNLSCEELIDISLKYFGTDDLLHYIVQRSSKLKRLCLWCCYDITGSGLSRAVELVPQLEDLNLGYTSITAQDISLIGQNCPRLTTFKMDQMLSGQFDEHAVTIGTNMRGLRVLQIYGGEMTNEGFKAILDGCCDLEVFHVHMSKGLFLDGNLVKECMERVRDFQHNATERFDEDGDGSDDDVAVGDDEDSDEDDDDYYDWV